MALKDIWVDKKNGIDDVDAEPINEIAHSVIELEKQVGKIDSAFDELHSYAQNIISGGAQL